MLKNIPDYIENDKLSSSIEKKRSLWNVREIGENILDLHGLR